MKLLIMASDVDSSCCAAIVYYLMKEQNMSYSSATEIAKERRMSLQTVTK